MQKRINFIEDLSRADLDLLAELLSFRNTTANDSIPNEPFFPSEDWLASQANKLSSFPAHLLRATSLLPKLAMNMPFRPPKAVLCSVHKPLNPFLIHRIFMQLGAEAGLRVQNLIDAAEREDAMELKGRKKDNGNGEEMEKEMDWEVRAWLRRLTTMNSLWMSPANYRTKFRAMPNDERFERLESGCMACILAFVGGQTQAVLDLRTSLLGRKKSGHESRLWGFVEAWSRRPEHAGRIRNESERVGKLVMRERRRIRRRKRKERREQRLKRKNSGGEAEAEAEADTAALLAEHDADDMDDDHEDTMSDVAPRDGMDQREAEERNFEASIIDFYGDVDKADEDELHFAFRRPVAYDSISGTFYRQPAQAPQQKSSKYNRPVERVGAASRATFYTQSVYSQHGDLDSGFGGSSSSQSLLQHQERRPPLPKIINPFVQPSARPNKRDRHAAEKHAESYQKLVRRQPPSEEAMSDHMRKLWTEGGGQGGEDDVYDGEQEEQEERNKAADERVKRALADAYGERSKTDDEKRAAHLTRWSGMMAQGGAKKWLGS